MNRGDDVTGSELDRRTLLRAGLAVGALGLVGALVPLPAAARPPDLTEVTLTPGRGNGALPPPGRYLFRLLTTFGVVAEVARIEEVWAHHQYTRLTGVEILYAGPGAPSLSATERAVVQVATAAGAAPTDDSSYFVQVLAACTRIPPVLLNQRLATLGAPGVEAALAMAPEAPQAPALSRWLGDGQG